MVFADEAKQAITAARSEAHRLRHESVRPEHYALGLLCTPSPSLSALLADTPVAELASAIEAAAGPGTAALELHDLPYSDGVRAVIESAFREVRAAGHDAVGCDHLLLGLLGVDGTVSRALFMERGLTAERVRDAARRARSRGAAYRRLVQMAG